MNRHCKPLTRVPSLAQTSLEMKLLAVLSVIGDSWVYWLRKRYLG